MNKQFRILIGIFASIVGIVCSAFAMRMSESAFSDAFAVDTQQQPPPAKKDTVRSRYPVTKTTVETYEDVNKTSPADLENPENIKKVIEYDPDTDTYIVHTIVGDMEVGAPYIMSPAEYQEYSLRESFIRFMQSQQEQTGDNAKKKTPFSLTDMSFDLGPADKIFGPGGIQIKTQGFAEVSFGFQHRSLDNPTQSQRNRNRTTFKFDENVQMDVKASVGDKLNFNLNYNTDATFDFDQQQIKLKYEGKEDEIIKYIEAGNVSMNTTNSLVRGGSSLFGIRTDLQFGRFKVSALASQQQSQSQSVSMDRGAQMTPFEISIDQYDENRHFFLSQFFYENYDKWIEKLPYISSGVTIERVEAWITNKRANYEQARNIVAFSDLAESRSIYNPVWTPQGSTPNPYNAANTLYREMTTTYASARSISQVTQTLSALEGSSFFAGRDYEKIESARKLLPSEFTINAQLGYISLNTVLQPDEILAVAFEYRYNGRVFQVGEFSSDNIAATDALFLKLLKNTNLSPQYPPTWKLMMKNIYALGSYQIQSDRFVLNITYQSDTTGVYLNYIPETVKGKKNPLWLRVLGLDRLDSKREPHPDGFFDYVEGFTVFSQNGRVVFPSTEPFGKGLLKAIDDETIAKKYMFEALYDSTLTVARQIAEQNKFKLTGEYKGNSSDVIRLNGVNIPRGSVTVMAGGVALVEGSDYTVNYTMGEVRIINPSILSAGTPITASYESQSLFNMQRKTLLGLNLSYDFSENFSIGGTIMNLTEKPLTTKVNMGDESVNNLLWGLNTSFRTQSQALTNLIDKLPFIEATAPSQISLNAEFAQLIPSHAGGVNHSYLDDFESTQTGWSLMSPYEWYLSSTPSHFPEASSTGVEYGKNRALMSWYTIDRMFTNRNSSITPSHIKNDLNQLSDHRVREVFQTELFPDKETLYNEPSTLSIFNLAYYPRERGPYNLDAQNIEPSTGFLLRPETRWGGMMRKIISSYTDFEKNNFEFIEFWLMDPFLVNQGSNGGELYIELGDVSEDILKDGKKFYENGMPADDDMSKLEKTVWGYVPKRQALVYAFDSQVDIRKQDVGLDGLPDEKEKTFDTYATYLKELENRLTPGTIARMQDDPFSPFNDPSADDYHHYRGTDFDARQASIMERYKRYTGTEGNSTNLNESSTGYTTASQTKADAEDIDEDFTLNETERYYEYKIDLRPEKMKIGENFIVDMKTRPVRLRNGEEASVNWYQFKVPINNYSSTKGNISDFKSIRFMRMFLTQFSDTTVLRFGTLELVRGEWRKYERDLNNPNLKPSSDASLDVSSVNIEENGSRRPVNYVLPPGISRILDPSQPQLRQNNEQSLSLRLFNLASGDARAVYKNMTYDMRQYRRIQLFVHAEKYLQDNDLADGQVAIFVRLGSDYKNNYYEYEVPLNITPAGIYNTYSAIDQLSVWPRENMIDILFEKFTDLKLRRNEEKRKAGSDVTFYTPYYSYDSDNPRNKITIVGNPSLSEVKTVMIGVRNNSNTRKSVEVWVNELRLTDFNEDGGWAARGNLNVSLSDLATINAGAHIETAGFGGIEQSVGQRRLDDYYMYNFAASVDLGRFVPKAAKLTAPFYYAYSKQINSPKYNPLDGDILLSESLKSVQTQAEKDSIKAFSQDKLVNTSLSLSGIKVNANSKNPMPYDPANFSISYSQNSTERQNPTIAWETTKDYRLNLTYAYSPAIKPFEPFAKNKSKSPVMKPIQAFNINYLPNSISLTSDISRSYYEIQLRDMSNPGSSNFENVPIAYRKEFYWNRGFDLNWKLTKGLQLVFNNTTNARIEEPDVVVNKELYPDEYKIWKDSVWQSIRGMGTPLSYSQRFNLSYTLPLALLPGLDWINSTAKYSATYTWDKGAFIDAETILGNEIANNVVFQLDGSFDFMKLYNKSPFLKEVNAKFNPTRNTAVSNRRPNARDTQKKSEPKKFEQQITLSNDSAVVVTHNLNTKNIRVRAYRSDSTSYPIKYKLAGNSGIRIQNRDTIPLKIRITIGPDAKEASWYKVAQYAARGMMMVRRATVMYNQTNMTQIPGFLPEIGDFTGQGNGGAPGWNFAFGFVDGKSYVHEAKARGWLLGDSTVISPAVLSHSRDFSATVELEPIRGLKIDLNGRWNHIESSSIQYMFNGMPETRGGQFTMTTIALRSAFEKSNSANGYFSGSFNRFLENRAQIAARINGMYDGTRYPEGTMLAGQPFDAANGGVDVNSPDVLIPAFLSAYTVGSPNTMSLSAFPSIASLLPNWKISYDGLSHLPWIKDNLKSVVLSHNYQSTYKIGAYDSYQTWMPVAGRSDIGFVTDVQSDLPVPAFQYAIASVIITEVFAPLVGLTVTLKNNISCTGEYKTSRTLSLNMSANQIVEALREDFVLGIGYKFINFNEVLKMKAGKNVNHDLTLRGDISYNRMVSIIRKIDEAYNEPVSGTQTMTIKLSADYNFSKALTLRAFFDRQVNTPLVSSTSFPISTTNFGMAVRFSLAR